jgi:hypothetical protein
MIKHRSIHKHKHRLSKRRNQKGGDLLNPFTWFQGDDWGGWFSNIGTKASNTTNNLLNSANNTLGTAASNIASGTQNAIDTAGKALSTNIPLTGSSDSTQYKPVEVAPIQQEPKSIQQELEPIQQEPVPAKIVQDEPKPIHELSIGGKRRKYTLKGRKHMKGGGLGLTYYATPVSNMKVAEPTYWEVYANGTNQYNIKGGSKKRKTRKTKRRTNKRNRRTNRKN